MKKINYILLLISTLIFLTLLYGTSLSCDYNITIKTKESTYNGVCQFGITSWVETIDTPLNGSIWHVNSLSFSYKNQLFYLITNRERIYKVGETPNKLDIFNTQFDNILLLKYEYYDISKNQLALFSIFPNEHIYIAEVHGKLSVLSSKKDNR